MVGKKKKLGKNKGRERDEEKRNVMQTMKQTFQVAEDLQAYDECHLSKGVTEHSSRDVSYRQASYYAVPFFFLFRPSFCLVF